MCASRRVVRNKTSETRRRNKSKVYRGVRAEGLFTRHRGTAFRSLSPHGGRDARGEIPNPDMTGTFRGGGFIFSSGAVRGRTADPSRSLSVFLFVLSGADRSRGTQSMRRSKSTHVGTRKMVNYARAGRSQRKLWWRSVAILTCKSIVGPGYRGERLIEPSSSWFPPKFPSG